MSRLAGQFSRIVSSSHLCGRLFLPLCATVTCLFLFDDGPLLNYQRSNEPSQCLANLFLPLLLLTSIRPLPLVFSRNLVFVSNTNFRSHRIGHTAFLHFTRACLRLIGNKIRKGESYVYASFIYLYIYGRKFERVE